MRRQGEFHRTIGGLHPNRSVDAGDVGLHPAVRRNGVQRSVQAVGVNVAVGSVGGNVAFHAQQIDPAVGSFRVQAALQVHYANGAVARAQTRRAGTVLGADGTVGGGDPAEDRVARDLDHESRSLIVAPQRWPHYADGNGIGAVVDTDLQVVGLVLRGAVPGAADVHVVLIPAGNLHGAVEGLDRKPSTGL